MKEIWIGNKLNQVCGSAHNIYKFNIKDLKVEVLKWHASCKNEFNGILEQKIYYKVRLSFKGKEFIEFNTTNEVPLEEKLLTNYILFNLNNNDLYDLFDQIYFIGVLEGEDSSKRKIRQALGFEDEEEC